jgi:hypothetical protein
MQDLARKLLLKLLDNEHMLVHIDHLLGTLEHVQIQLVKGFITVVVNNS